MRVQRPEMGQKTFDEGQEALTGAKHQEATRSQGDDDDVKDDQLGRPDTYDWRNQYGGMKAEEAKRLKESGEESKRRS